MSLAPEFLSSLPGRHGRSWFPVGSVPSLPAALAGGVALVYVADDSLAGHGIPAGSYAVLGEDARPLACLRGSDSPAPVAAPAGVLGGVRRSD